MTEQTEHPAAPFQLSRDEWGRLTLTDISGRRHPQTRLKRMFPITDPDGWIQLRDHQGREIAHITDLDQLPAAQREIISEELAQTEFLPRIHHIVKIHRDGEALHWVAETDRGRTQFTLENADRIRPLGEHGLLIVDEHGIRYLVSDVGALDSGSRRKLEWCLF